MYMRSIFVTTKTRRLIYSSILASLIAAIILAMGLLCLFFAHFLGRSIVRVRRGQRARSFYGWLIRTAITGGAILWRRGLDGIAIVAFTLAAASLVVGMW